MRAFLARRLIMGVVAILGATVIVFVLSRVGGQDPRFFYLGNTPGYAVTQEQWDAWGEKLGLDKPVIVQYFLWVGGVIKGDLGNSTQSGRTVLSLIAERAPATGQLALGGWIFGAIVGLPLGVFSAVRRGGVLDYLARGFALIGASHSNLLGVNHGHPDLLGLSGMAPLRHAGRRVFNSSFNSSLDHAWD